MKLSDLKTGMKLIDRSGGEWTVLENIRNPYREIEDTYILKDGGWMSESSYDDELKCKNDSSYDIMRVYAQNEGKYIDGSILMATIEDMDLIWERNEKKEMTISEIEKELGYSIKIIKED